MTKRFTLHINWYNPQKTEGEAELKDNGQPILISEDIEDIRYLKDLLNEQHETIQRLEAQLSHIEYRFTEYRNKVGKND